MCWPRKIQGGTEAELVNKAQTLKTIQMVNKADVAKWDEDTNCGVNPRNAIDERLFVLNLIP